jgi:LmbE family N-acetylglucosaminyl deacetylase
MRRFFATIAILTALCAPAAAQQNPYIAPTGPLPPLPADQGVTALQQDLQRLHTRASLLLIVAHPDDEDSGMLAYQSRGHGVRTGMLTLTRGEGGQNVMTGDFNDALGLIRTQELLAEDQYSAVDQFFSTTADFGFSKTMDETLANWTWERSLCDAVLAVRTYRPLVVASVFLGGPTDGHGHHQVSGRLSQEVFTAAADPAVCPDQIARGLLPWQPLKIYDRVPTFSISSQGIYDYATGQYAPARFYNYVSKTWIDGAPSTDVVIPEGQDSPLLGTSFYNFAHQGLALQKTQITNAIPFNTGAHNVPYHRFAADPSVKLPAGNAQEKDFFDGIDTSLASIASLAPSDKTLPIALAAIDADVTKAIAQLDPAHPESIAPLLADGLARTNALLSHLAHANLPASERYNATSELLRKQAQFNTALIHALGLNLTISTNSASSNITPSSTVSGSMQLAAASPLDDVTFTINAADHNAHLITTSPLSATFTLTIPTSAASTRPYFTRPSIEQSFYNIADENLRLQPTTPFPFVAAATVRYQNVHITLQQILTQNSQPLVIVPPVSVSTTPSSAVIPFDKSSITLTARVHTDSPSGAAGTLHLNLPTGWTAQPASIDFHITPVHDQKETFTIAPHNLSAQSYTVSAVATVNGHTFTDGYTSVGYPGLIHSNLYRPAVTHISGVDLHVAPNLRIAYLQGTGDDLPAALVSIGLNVTTVSLDDLVQPDLRSRFDELFLGVRSYTAHPTLPLLDPQFEAFVRAGGVLITQYNSKPFASTPDHPIAPYPFDLSSFPENVVEEQAPITLLEPDHPLFTFPNRITSADFNNWIEERGHSFLRTWDPHYTALTQTHDAGQSPQRGGLLFARSGCGAYVYLAYALYRQTPEGVPGAYRLLANLASLPRNSAAVGCTTH